MVQSAEVIAVNIEEEMRGSYLDYAMSVIIGRAIPDVRDGLKPVHRRILYAMYREGLLASKRFSKCAGVVGEVLKKFHPHGDMAVYDALVRMAQEWNMRYPLIEGQGNFGSVDGDSAAAYRYTECRLTKLAEELLADIDKETVDFQANFDASLEEPIVLPSRVPNLLLNGSDGIAVGMATKIPPHNLREVVDALLALIKKPDSTVAELMRLIPGPDFPTGAFIFGRQGIREAYETGRGSVRLRAKAMIEPIARGDREQIVVTEIPFQVNKARLIERIADLVQDGKMDGVSDIRDESDRDGMRIVVELKRGAVAGVVLNQLYAHTAMETSFGVIMLSIVNNQPRVLNLREMLQQFVDHRKEVVVRRTVFELREAEARAHILEGLKIALEHIDAVIELIKKSKSPEIAREGLMKKYGLSERQAQAILEMRLQRLTGLERDKIIAEYEEVVALIKHLKAILADERLVYAIIETELKDLRERFGDERRSEIQEATGDLTIEDLIQEEDMVVTISHRGYIKRSPISIYRAQRRGGHGKLGMTTGDEDFVKDLFIASTHSYLLIFSGQGRLYWLKVHEIPQIGRTAKGKSITNLIRMPSDDYVAAVLPIREFHAGTFVMVATANGIVKKTALTEYSNPRPGGIIGAKVESGDRLIAARLTNGTQDILLSTRQGMAIRFPESGVRSMARGTVGVFGVRMDEGDQVVSMEVLQEKATLLTVAAKGFGKRTPLDEYPVQRRGGRGVITLKTTERNGPVMAVLQVNDTDDIMFVSTAGTILRTRIREISLQGRNTQGVRLVTMGEGEEVASAAKLAEPDEEPVGIE
ncbi:MAG: DNA gyrase subunit A [Deltaproteobacteria bacterium]|nr:DNA gyrase subunit A [Deltaproteobacteria bacterium]